MNYLIMPGLKYRDMVENPNIDKIIDTVCLHFGVRKDDVISNPTRRREIVFPRQVAMYLIKKHTVYTYKSIGCIFKNRGKDRDHSTVMHSIRVVSNLMETDPLIFAHVVTIENKIK